MSVLGLQYGGLCSPSVLPAVVQLQNPLKDNTIFFSFSFQLQEPYMFDVRRLQKLKE